MIAYLNSIAPNPNCRRPTCGGGNAARKWQSMVLVEYCRSANTADRL